MHLTLTKPGKRKQPTVSEAPFSHAASLFAATAGACLSLESTTADLEHGSPPVGPRRICLHRLCLSSPLPQGLIT
ncbi:hypothetical protein V8C40DRAFT_241005 [Trichoderma camerunense]